jgi:hypothetical protein
MKWLLILILLIRIKNQSTDQNFELSCNDLIYNGNVLNQQEINEICLNIPNDSSFLIRVQNTIHSTVSGSVIYESSAASYFLENCLNHGTMCDNGFMIDLYTDDNIIIIRPGGIVKNVIKDNYRQRVMSSLRLIIMKKQWANVLINSVKLLYYKINKGSTRLNYPYNLEHWKFIFTVLSPLLLIMFLSFTLILYYVSAGIINKDAFDYINQLIKNFNEISETSDNKIEIVKCLFCWKVSDTNHSFLYCNHFYHERCLKRWNLYETKCCPCSYEPKDDDNQDIRLPEVTKQDLAILLGLCYDAFRKEDIYEYIYHNQKKVDKFNLQLSVMKMNINELSLEDLLWIQPKKLKYFIEYRIFFKMWKVFKLMCWILAFWPRKLLSNKNAKLVSKLINIRAKGASIGKF